MDNILVHGALCSNMLFDTRNIFFEPLEHVVPEDSAEELQHAAALAAPQTPARLR